MKLIGSLCLILFSFNLFSQDIEGYITHPPVPSCDAGSISLTINGGFDEYKYEWSNGEMSKDIINLEPGEYRVTVTDNLCGTAELSFELECGCPDCEIIADITDETCIKKGEIDIEIDCGSIPSLSFTYAWSDGYSEEDRTDLDQGEYSLTVSDINGCTYEDSYIVGGTTVLKIEITDVVNLTDCSIHNGKIDAEILSGTPPYNIEWSNGATNTLSLTNLNVGWHTLTVTDANNCSQSVSKLLCCCSEANNTYVCPDSGPITIEGTVSVENKSIATTVTGGTTDYICTWSGPGIDPDESFGCGGINNLELGKYYLEVNDGCNVITECFILADCSDVELDISATDIVFPCEDFFNTGSITASVTGGEEPYSYNWESLWFSDTGNEKTLSNVYNGPFSITVTDANGCSETAVLEIDASVNGVFSTNIGCDVLCNGEVVETWIRTLTNSTTPGADCGDIDVICDNPFPIFNGQLNTFTYTGYLEGDVVLDENSIDPFTCSYKTKNSVTGEYCNDGFRSFGQQCRQCYFEWTPTNQVFNCEIDFCYFPDVNKTYIKKITDYTNFTTHITIDGKCHRKIYNNCLIGDDEVHYDFTETPCLGDTYFEVSCNLIYSVGQILDGNPFGGCNNVVSENEDPIETRFQSDHGSPSITSSSCNEISMSFYSELDQVVPIRLMDDQLDDIAIIKYDALQGQNFVTINFGEINLKIRDYLTLKLKIGEKVTYKDFTPDCMEKSIVLSPNPVQNSLRIQINTIEDQNIKMEILNSQGQLIEDVQLRAIEGENDFYQNVESLPNGFYFIKFTYENKDIITDKFVKY